MIESNGPWQPTEPEDFLPALFLHRIFFAKNQGPHGVAKQSNIPLLGGSIRGVLTRLQSDFALLDQA